MLEKVINYAMFVAIVVLLVIAIRSQYAHEQKLNDLDMKITSLYNTFEGLKVKSIEEVE